MKKNFGFLLAVILAFQSSMMTSCGKDDDASFEQTSGITDPLVGFWRSEDNFTLDIYSDGYCWAHGDYYRWQYNKETQELSTTHKDVQYRIPLITDDAWTAIDTNNQVKVFKRVTPPYQRILKRKFINKDNKDLSYFDGYLRIINGRYYYVQQDMFSGSVFDDTIHVEYYDPKGISGEVETKYLKLNDFVLLYRVKGEDNIPGILPEGVNLKDIEMIKLQTLPIEPDGFNGLKESYVNYIEIHNPYSYSDVYLDVYLRQDYTVYDYTCGYSLAKGIFKPKLTK